MQSYPWAEGDEFRAQLPDFTHLTAELPAACKAYQKFYKFQFKVPHVYHMGRFRSGAFDLVGQIFLPKNHRGILFIYHGYFDHLGLYEFPIRLGLELGLAVIAFDLPGHGLSSGPAASISCFSDYAKAQKKFISLCNSVSQLQQGPRFALGQSTGAAVILDAVLSQSVPKSELYYPNGVILLAPLLRVANWYRVRLLYQILRHQGGTVRTFQNNSSNVEFVTFLSEADPMQHRRIEAPWVGAMIRYTKRIVQSAPVDTRALILQGDLDKTVDFPYNVPKLRSLLSQAHVVMLEGARHHLVNEIEEYRQRIGFEVKRFINENI